MDKASLIRRASSLAADVKSRLLERWGQFRAESPYFQAKVGLVGAYVVVVALTLALAPPDADPWVCREERLSFGLAFKTAVEITNVDNGDLEDVVVEVKGTGIEYDGRRVPGTWRTKPLTLVEGLKTKLLTEQLFDARGVSPPYSLEVDLVTVLDDDNEAVVSLVPDKSGARP